MAFDQDSKHPARQRKKGVQPLDDVSVYEVSKRENETLHPGVVSASEGRLCESLRPQ